TSDVQYGLRSYTSTTPTDSTMVSTHSVPLSNLTPSTLYHFRVASTNSSGGLTLSPDSTFTTAASAPLPSAISLSAASSTRSVAAGNAVTDAITATLSSGSAVSVSFAASGLPAGVSASFSPSTCTATCSTTLTLSAARKAADGTYKIAVTGSSSAPLATTTVTLTVGAGGPIQQPPPSPPPPTGGDITTGLAARWTMTEGSGSYAYDTSGNGNTATLYNPTWWTSDYGTTVLSSGSGSYGSVNDSASLKMSTQLTVSIWLRPSQNADTDPRVITKLFDWDVKLNGANHYPQLS